jgi:hypothetical protein
MPQEFIRSPLAVSDGEAEQALEGTRASAYRKPHPSVRPHADLRIVRVVFREDPSGQSYGGALVEVLGPPEALARCSEGIHDLILYARLARGRVSFT